MLKGYREPKDPNFNEKKKTARFQQFGLRRTCIYGNMMFVGQLRMICSHLVCSMNSHSSTGYLDYPQSLQLTCRRKVDVTKKKVLVSEI